MAVKFNVCLIVASEISREPEYRALPDRRPIISDLTVDGTMLYNFNSQIIDTIELIQYDNGDKKVIQLYLPSLDKNESKI